MKYIFDETFLLQSNLAVQLYQDFAKNLPIIDYHNHLSPQKIQENNHFDNMTEIWLDGDHYKWRAMRTMGVKENLITGSANPQEKFKSWAAIVPHTMRNPLYHWTHLELKNPFGIEDYLNENNADVIYQKTSMLLQEDKYRPQQLLTNFNVEMLGTTDDAIDDLKFHIDIKNSDFKTDVKPTFRPDKVFNIDKGDDFRDYLQKLSQISGIEISDYDSLIKALQNRIDFFDSVGCVASDHGLSQLPKKSHLSLFELNVYVKEVINGNDQYAVKIKGDFLYHTLLQLCCFYKEKQWVQQFHLGALRNTNTQKLGILGADTGYDSIGDYSQAVNMASFFNELELIDGLSKTIIYNLNPADNAMFATMIGNFQGEDVKGKIQFGSGWWFLDQLDGMTNQINDLSNYGLLSCFIGMLTDSRSFLSYSRHEYFRRLLCNLLAEDVNKGYLPNDINWIGNMIANICYHNAKNYFKS